MTNETVVLCCTMAELTADSISLSHSSRRSPVYDLLFQAVPAKHDSEVSISVLISLSLRKVNERRGRVGVHKNRNRSQFCVKTRFSDWGFGRMVFDDAHNDNDHSKNATSSTAQLS